MHHKDDGKKISNITSFETYKHKSIFHLKTLGIKKKLNYTKTVNYNPQTLTSSLTFIDWLFYLTKFWVNWVMKFLKKKRKKNCI